MNESQWNVRRRDRRATRREGRAALSHSDAGGSLIRFGTGAGKGRSARYCLQTYRPRRRMPGTADRGKKTALAPGARRRRCFESSAERRATSRDSVTSNEKWFHSSRLETRTKEPSIPESIDVMKTSMRNESDDEKRTRSQARACATHFLPILKLVKLAASCASVFSIDLSRIWNTGTRKRMNYSCAGWSQWKHWWRAKAVLTCKLFVRHVNSGERPIESSNSWFLPKFP